MDSINDPKIQAALIGAFVGVFVMVIKDVLLRIWFDNRKVKTEEKEVFRQYADPLSTAAMNLLWRLNEIFNRKHKSSYLLIRYTTDYAVYKRLSTIYRLASLLGWLRAFRKELALLKSSNSTELKEIKDSINEFRSSLADGEHAEVNRLEGLLNLWSIGFDGKEPKTDIASSIDQEIKDYISKRGQFSAFELSEEEKAELCKMVAKEMTASYDVEELPIKVVKSTQVDTIKLCSLTESWIYRDWQDAIGDMMLKEKNDKSNDRIYDVMGFYEFEFIYRDEDHKDRKWIKKLENVFFDLNVSEANEADTRLRQIENVTSSTSKLLLALTKRDKAKKLMMSKTLELAKRLQKD